MFELLPGGIKGVAEAVGVTSSAVSQWPEELPARIADRVLAALARKHLSPEIIGSAPSSAAGGGELAAETGKEAGLHLPPEILDKAPAATETPHAA